MSQIRKITDSARELKKVQALAAIAMLLALRVVLGFFANATLPFFGSTHKISGAFLPIAVTGAMFGPIPAALVGALGDIISFMFAPSPAGYFPGFTISGFLTGFIYGVALYKSKPSIVRVVVAWVVNMLTVETFLAAFWLFWLLGATSGKGYIAFLLVRFAGAAIKCIPEILLIFITTKLASKIPTINRSQVR